MLLADSNIWLALALSQHAFHQLMSEWFEQHTSTGGLLFCRSTQQSFLRLLTTTAVAAPYGIPALSNKAAWSLYQAFLDHPQISWVDEPPELDAQWKKLASRNVASPKLWMDAYLAAFAIVGSYQLVTTDQAFKQFKGLDLLLLTET